MIFLLIRLIHFTVITAGLQVTAKKFLIYQFESVILSLANLKVLSHFFNYTALQNTL